jgi:hypothetical protein
VAKATKTKPKRKRATKKSGTNLKRHVLDERADHKRKALREIVKDPPPPTAQELEALAMVSKPKMVAGPFAIYPHHRNLWKVAASERSRYTLNAVALYPAIPGLVATDGRVLATAPIQSIDPQSGEPGPWGENFHKPGGNPILLPLKLFRKIPTKLEPGQTHMELSIISMPDPTVGTRLFAIRDDCPYGNRYRYPLDLEGAYPEYTAVLKSADEYEPKKGVEVNLDVDYLVNLAKAIGSKRAVLKIFDTKVNGASLMMPIESEWDGPPSSCPTGIIMPITLPDQEKGSTK